MVKPFLPRPVSDVLGCGSATIAVTVDFYFRGLQGVPFVSTCPVHDEHCIAANMNRTLCMWWPLSLCQPVDAAPRTLLSTTAMCSCSLGKVMRGSALSHTCLSRPPHALIRPQPGAYYLHEDIIPPLVRLPKRLLGDRGARAITHSLYTARQVSSQIQQCDAMDMSPCCAAGEMNTMHPLCVISSLRRFLSTSSRALS
jgi:hypothetical protein